jgi:hypothetical protein
VAFIPRDPVTGASETTDISFLASRALLRFTFRDIVYILCLNLLLFVLSEGTGNFTEC